MRFLITRVKKLLLSNFSDGYDLSSDPALYCSQCLITISTIIAQDPRHVSGHGLLRLLGFQATLNSWFPYVYIVNSCERELRSTIPWRSSDTVPCQIFVKHPTTRPTTCTFFHYFILTFLRFEYLKNVYRCAQLRCMYRCAWATLIIVILNFCNLQ